MEGVAEDDSYQGKEAQVRMEAGVPVRSDKVKNRLLVLEVGATERVQDSLS